MSAVRAASDGAEAESDEPRGSRLIRPAMFSVPAADWRQAPCVSDISPFRVPEAKAKILYKVPVLRNALELENLFSESWFAHNGFRFPAEPREAKSPPCHWI